MKKFVFTLQRILAYKKNLYEKERNELSRLRHERNTLQQRRDSTEAQMLGQDQKFRRRAAGVGVTTFDVNQVNYYRTASNSLIKELEASIQDLDVQIEKQLQIVIQLDQDVQGLEKLREKQWEEYQAEVAREEQERILEIVSSKFLEGQIEAAQEEAAAQVH